jgi:hypothetical protein
MGLCHFQKMLGLLNSSSGMSVSVAQLAGGTSVSPIDVNQATSAFHQHVSRLILNAEDNPCTASSTEYKVIYCTYEARFALTLLGAAGCAPSGWLHLCVLTEWLGWSVLILWT